MTRRALRATGSRSTRRAWVLPPLCTACLVLAACSDDAPAGLGAPFTACEGTSECDTGLSCECGFCTRVCETNAECSEVRAGANCVLSSGDPACVGATAAASVCAVECGGSGECRTGEACVSGRCRGTASPTDGGMDGGVSPDGSTPDGTAADAGPVECDPHTWFCNGTGARYCNAAGDGVVREVDCGGRACVDGLCEPRRGIDLLCGALKNGDRGELVGGVPCPSMPNQVDTGWSFTLWLDRGDEVTVAAEALSPLVEAHIRFSHGCSSGDPERCETSDASDAGGRVELRRTAARREAISINLRLVRASGDPDDVEGARLGYDISVVPADRSAPPPSPSCAVGSRECTGMSTLTYCSDDGQFTREQECFATFPTHVNSCASGFCTAPRGDSCADAVPVERRPFNESMFDASLWGVNDNLDPGTSCLDIGMSGVDRVFQLEMVEGERVTATLRSGGRSRGGENYAIYVVEDCLSPETSCVAGSLSYRFFESSTRFDRNEPELTYIAPRDQTVYFVVDTEHGDPDVPQELFRTISFVWDGTCHDGSRNGGEVGVDCGGPCPRLCPDGQPCDRHEDCQSQYCEPMPGGYCTTPSVCGDGVLSRGEECDDGNTVDDDWCSNRCVVATCDDGIRNGDETTTDGGGYCAFDVRDVCRRAEPIPLIVDIPADREYTDQLFLGSLDGATDAFTPSCGANGPDHAYRLAVERESEISVYAVAVDEDGIDPSREITATVVQGCGGAVSECVTSGAGEVDYLVRLSPGEYTLWVDGTSAAAAGAYELIISGWQR